MDDSKSKENLGKAVAEHAAGTIILGSAMAGIGAIAGLRRGGSIKNEAALAGIMGTLGGLGFGRTVYKGLFGSASTHETAQSATWTDRVSQPSQAAKGR